MGEYGTCEMHSLRTSDVDGDGKKEIVIAYSDCERVAGNNPRNDTGTRNIRVYRNNSILVISHDLGRIERYVIAEKWTKFNGFKLLITDAEKGVKPGILSLADRAILLGFREWR
jgi:hypothetical protein